MTHRRAGKKVERCQPCSAFLLPVPVQKNVKGQLFQIPSLRPAVAGQNQDRLLRLWLRKAPPLTCSTQSDGREGPEVACIETQRASVTSIYAKDKRALCGTGEDKSKELTCLQTTSVRTDPKEVSTRLRIPVLL